MNRERPNVCDNLLAFGGKSLAGPYLIMKAPACPLLRELLKQYRVSKEKKYLAVTLNGSTKNGVAWEGYSAITLVDGDWDDRFKCKPNGEGDHHCEDDDDDDDDGDHHNSSGNPAPR